jgi:hypothetical protein
VTIPLNHNKCAKGFACESNPHAFIPQLTNPPPPPPADVEFATEEAAQKVPLFSSLLFFRCAFFALFSSFLLRFLRSLLVFFVALPPPRQPPSFHHVRTASLSSISLCSGSILERFKFQRPFAQGPRCLLSCSAAPALPPPPSPSLRRPSLTSRRVLNQIIKKRTNVPSFNRGAAHALLLLLPPPLSPLCLPIPLRRQGQRWRVQTEGPRRFQRRLQRKVCGCACVLMRAAKRSLAAASAPCALRLLFPPGLFHSAAAGGDLEEGRRVAEAAAIENWFCVAESLVLVLVLRDKFCSRCAGHERAKL